jgi:hypothetical protein
VWVSSSNFASGGALENWSATIQNSGDTDDAHDSDGDPNTHDASLILQASEIDKTLDFGFIIDSSYDLTKQLNTPNPVRPDDPISFTIRITNTGNSWIDNLPLRDDYDVDYLTYGFGSDFATPDSDDHVNDGVLNWTDVLNGSPLAPGANVAITVTFTARKDTNALPNDETVNNATVSGAQADPDGPGGPLQPLEALPEQTASDGVTIYNPTGVVISSFVAAPLGANVQVVWRTASEVATLGYNVLRRAEGEKDFRTINAELIGASFAGMSQGRRYRFIDNDVEAGQRYVYRLQIILLNGGSTVYGAADIIVPSDIIFVPTIQKR